MEEATTFPCGKGPLGISINMQAMPWKPKLRKERLVIQVFEGKPCLEERR